MKNIEIDFSTYPEDAIAKQGKASASCGQWLDAITALLASDHEVRVEFNECSQKRSGDSQCWLSTYFNIDKNKPQKHGVEIRSSDGSHLKVKPVDRQLLANFLTATVRSSLQLRVLTWNIGTAAVLERGGDSKKTPLQVSVQLSYPENPHFLEIIAPKEKRYDIICLQEVPTTQTVLRKGGGCVWVGTFDGGAWLKYKCFVSLRGNNALITLVNRDLYGSLDASLSRTDLVFEKIMDSDSSEGSDFQGDEENDDLAVRHIYFPFAQKVPLLGGSIFNVHLIAGSLNEERNKNRIETRRKQLLELLAHSHESHNIVAGDFNVPHEQFDKQLPHAFRSKFICTPCREHTYEFPCEPQSGSKHYKQVLDYVGVWGRRDGKYKSALKVDNVIKLVQQWGFGKAHRHFPVEAKVAF
jgi:exonuclease III